MNTTKKPNTKQKTFQEASEEYLSKFDGANDLTILYEIRQLSYFINHLTLKLWHIREEAEEDETNDVKVRSLTDGKPQEEVLDSKDDLPF